MGRKATGSIIETTTAEGVTYSARFRASGKKRCQRLGSTAEGFTRAHAETELAYLLAQVERGDWTAPAAPAAIDEPRDVPTFHEFASEWYAARCPEWKPKTQAAYLGELSDHLLPFFGSYRLDAIDVEAVDRYRARKVAEGRIGATYINKTISRLGQILDVADERRLIDRNPVRINPRNRRLKPVKPRRHYLDRAEQIAALLDAAGAMDKAAEGDGRSRHSLSRRCLLAVLVFGGLRISEALALRWRDVDLASGRLYVDGTKTDAASRDVRLLPALAGELRAHKAGTRTGGPDDLVFATSTGAAVSRTNTRSRVLGPAIERANVQLVKAGHVPIPKGEGRGASLTQHGLRHTCISLRAAIGDDLAVIAREVGHADLSVTHRIYTHVMALDDGSRDRLRALVEGRPLPVLNGQVWTSDAAEGIAA